jgi:site-specific DNA-methyltransferase (adenine-specific)
MTTVNLRNGDCIEQMRQLEPNSVDSIVTDPPYELGFMGKSWDSTGIAYSVKMWDEALRVLKPGGHLLAFSGSRTYHRMVVAIEDAGFEIRDQIMWVYGSGFPKSLDVSKAIDKQAGVEREVVGTWKPQGTARLVGGKNPDGIFTNPDNAELKGELPITTPTTDKAKQWAGWGTALKPAHEPIVLARKPLIGTVATNVIIHGTGALNIDGSRVQYESLSDKEKALKGDAFKRKDVSDEGWSRPWMSDQNKIDELNKAAKERADQGRWPANFIHDGSDEVVELLEDAARFFYCAKASKKDRNEGLDGFAEKRPDERTESGMGTFTEKGVAKQSNHHPTVKPTELMRYLVRLVTPPNGTVLDPFMGSGSTGKAAVLENFSFIGIDQSADYLEIATARIQYAQELIESQLL